MSLNQLAWKLNAPATKATGTVKASTTSTMVQRNDLSTLQHRL